MVANMAPVKANNMIGSCQVKLSRCLQSAETSLYLSLKVKDIDIIRNRRQVDKGNATSRV